MNHSLLTCMVPRTLNIHIHTICTVLVTCAKVCESIELAVQAAYEDADSAATSLQAVAPIGLKHLQSDKLVMKEKAVLLQTVLADD